MTELRDSEPQYTRDQVVDVFKKFPAMGITNPDDLPQTDQDVISAYAFLRVWANQRETQILKTGTPEAFLECYFERSTLFVDAGFSDPDYLDEVANDLLVQDLQEAEEYGLTKLALRIQAKIDEINSKINT